MKKANNQKNKFQSTRKTYTPEQKEKARKYYLMGLYLPEISKLLDGVPVRTLEKWQLTDQWTKYKETQPIKARVYELSKSGKSYNEISKILNISRVTVWRWLKQVNSKTN